VLRKGQVRLGGHIVLKAWELLARFHITDPYPLVLSLKIIESTQHWVHIFHSFLREEEEVQNFIKKKLHQKLGQQFDNIQHYESNIKRSSINVNCFSLLKITSPFASLTHGQKKRPEKAFVKGC
jgi:hypothetical protein